MNCCINTCTRSRFHRRFRTLVIAAVLGSSAGRSETKADLAQQIAEIMSQSPSAHAGLRFVHAKGLVCEGTFEPSRQACTISKAPHLRGGSVPVTVRFSEGAPDTAVPDSSPQAGPQGMAIRFMMGEGTDIVAMSHNGFVVATGEEFLALQKAVFTTDPSKPHPWPIEEFLSSHPLAQKFVRDNAAVPASFASEPFFGNHAFRFINAEGVARIGRYQILPEETTQFLSEEAAKAKGADFLREELRSRLNRGVVKFRLMLQIAEPRDRTDDPSLVWPQDRKKIELGVITIRTTVPDSTAAERKLAFDPAKLVEGIELSDDGMPALRSMVYAIAAAHRMRH